MRAVENHTAARAAFGKNFSSIFPKLVELLPDTMKREALLAIQNTHATSEVGKPEPPPPVKAEPKRANKPVDPRYRKAVMSGTQKEREESAVPAGVTTVVAPSLTPTVVFAVQGAPRGQWGARPTPTTQQVSELPPRKGPVEEHVDVMSTEDFPSLHSRPAKGNKAKPP